MNTGAVFEVCRGCRHEVPTGALKCRHCGRTFDRSRRMHMPPSLFGQGMQMPLPYQMPHQQFPTARQPFPNSPFNHPNEEKDVSRKKKKSKKIKKKVESSSDEEEEVITMRTKVKNNKDKSVETPPAPPPAPVSIATHPVDTKEKSHKKREDSDNKSRREKEGRRKHRDRIVVVDKKAESDDESYENNEDKTAVYHMIRKQ